MAGVYSYLPLGYRVINKIKKIIGEEMEALGSTEILMSTLQNKEIWDRTNRWSSSMVDVWFKSELNGGTEVGFGWSHEEPITNMMKYHLSSYGDLPCYVHQFQNKLRNEARAKSGIMRCREFIMKDMYSYATNETDHMDFYNKTIDSYNKVFKRLGLGDITYVTSASGGVFTDKFSHEFQTICEAGEDIIYVHKSKPLAMNEEIFNDENLNKLKLERSDFVKKKAAEVGNIFTLGTRFSEALDLAYLNEKGEREFVFMGSYGIGPGRLMGTIVEALSDDKGIIWPQSVAPYRVHLLTLGDSKEVKEASEKLYTDLIEGGIEVIFDDREATNGEKFADADLLGMPWRVVVSERSIQAGGAEIKKRTDEKGEIISLGNVIDAVK
jgi:prolyl-tRNA synthetase